MRHASKAVPVAARNSKLLKRQGMVSLAKACQKRCADTAGISTHLQCCGSYGVTRRLNRLSLPKPRGWIFPDPELVHVEEGIGVLLFELAPKRQ